jgi:hypothetical protein
MRVTTVRFGADLWRLLEREAEFAGISTSQYIREAALARAAAATGARAQDVFELLAQTGPEPSGGTVAPGRSPASERARRAAADGISGARALAAQSEQALRHARALAAQSQETVRNAAQSQETARNGRLGRTAPP